MNKPKEIWIFSTINPEITGPFTVLGESCDSICWSYDNTNNNRCIVLKTQAGFTRRQAVRDCYEYHDKKIKREREELNEKRRLLKKFYAEEYYG